MIQVATLSLQGKRPSQQDRILVVPSEYRQGRLVAAVADGMGGMLAGDKAADIAVEALKQAAPELLNRMSHDFSQASQAFYDAYERANDRIRNYAEARRQPGAVGTTCVALALCDSRYMIMNIGDSRCYLIQAPRVRQITHDHTVADSLLQQGLLAAADYESSPLRNQLTKSLGPKEECEPDIFPRVEFGTVAPGNIFVLCSDGFYSKLVDTDLLKLADPAAEFDATLQQLAADALARQSTDNLSAVAVRI
jgi:protein phosphatase